MRNYLQPQNTGNVLGNTFSIYGKGFVAIFLIYFLPIVPFEIWQAEAKAANNTGLFVVGYIIGLIANLFIIGAIAIAVSDICLGNKPSLARSYKRIFSTIPGKLLVTNLLTTICWAIPALSLIVLFKNFSKANGTGRILLSAAIVVLVVVFVTFVLRLLFAASIVILEGVWAFKALKRSIALTRGFSWRNLGVLILLWIIVLVIWVVIVTLFVLLHVKSAFVGRMFTGVVAMITVPLFFIAVVLLYYDSRVRKEAYDTSALAEDLTR
jgi:hypothetical protein